VLLFFPSGRHMTISWRTVQPITDPEGPTKVPARYVGKIVEDLNKIAATGSEQERKDAETDLARTNWTSVAAAMQRCIHDFNDALNHRISQKMAIEFSSGKHGLPRIH